MSKTQSRPADKDLVPMRFRVKASYELALGIDKLARRLSRYGDASIRAFDERMALAGTAHTIATWWSLLDDELVEQRIQALIDDIRRDRQGIREENAKRAAEAEAQAERRARENPV